MENTKETKETGDKNMVEQKITEFDVEGVAFTEMLEEQSLTAMNGGYRGYITTKIPGNWKIEFQSGWYDCREIEEKGLCSDSYPLCYKYKKEHGQVDDVYDRIDSHKIYIRSLIGGLKNRILWFSRHKMTIDQKQELFRIYGPTEIVPVDKNIENVSEIQDPMRTCHIFAIVAPLPLEVQFLKASNGKPVIKAKTKRVIGENGQKDTFVFGGWQQILKAEYETKDL